MAERDRPPPHQHQVRPQRYEGGILVGPQKGPSTSKILAVLAGFPLGGTLLALAGLTFIGSVIVLCVSTPLFILFGPVLVPAAITVGLAVVAFLASGAIGLTGLAALSYVLSYLRQATSTMPEQLDLAKKRMQDMAG